MAFPAPMGPPPIEIVFSFDTTGSMSSALGTVRQNLKDIIERLFKDIPNLRIALIAHGDYCDATCGIDGHYVIKYLDFTNNVKRLCSFAESVSSTCGGDYPECYELALWTARNELSWAPGTQRAMAVIGDAIPHEASETQNTKNIDWKQETDDLFKMGVRIYSVQCQPNSGADNFYKELARRTCGNRMKLDEFKTIVEMFMAICYREHGAEFLAAYEKEIRTREGPGIRRELVNMFATLRDGDHDGSSGDDASAACPATPSTLRKLPSKGRTTVKKPRAKKLATAARGLKTKASALPPAARKWAKKDARTKTSKTTKATSKMPAIWRKKQLRESVPQSRFALNSLVWTRWKLAMTNDKTDDESLSDRRQKRKGYRKTNLFVKDTKQPAVYEFAVQPKRLHKLYVMFVRVTGGFTSSFHWDTYLLRTRNVMSQLDDVLGQGCKVFVRRALINKPITADKKTLKSSEDVRSFLAKTYDYAWNKRWFGKPRHRHVVKQGIVLSDSKH